MIAQSLSASKPPGIVEHPSGLRAKEADSTGSIFDLQTHLQFEILCGNEGEQAHTVH